MQDWRDLFLLVNLCKGKKSSFYIDWVGQICFFFVDILGWTFYASCWKMVQHTLSCVVNTARFLRYVWQFFNIVYERSKNASLWLTIPGNLMKKKNIKTFYRKVEILAKHIFLKGNEFAEVNPQAPNNKSVFC